MPLSPSDPSDSGAAPVRFRPVVSGLWALGLALAGALVWAIITAVTDRQLGLIAIAVGLLAGAGAARGGRTRQAQIVGAAAAVIGYFAGQMLPIVWLLVQQSAPGHELLGVLAIVLSEMVEQTLTSSELVYLASAAVGGYVAPRLTRAWSVLRRHIEGALPLATPPR